MGSPPAASRRDGTGSERLQGRQGANSSGGDKRRERREKRAPLFLLVLRRWRRAALGQTRGGERRPSVVRKCEEACVFSTESSKGGKISE
eukprot:scaffold308058_cov21-Tisochrysis_lutea.AAC.1